MPSTDELIEAFLSALSPRTRKAYDGDLRNFARFLGDVPLRVAVEFLIQNGPRHANQLALAYTVWMRDERHLCPATIARRHSALRSLVEAAATIGDVTWSLKVRSPKVETYRDTTGPGREGWRRMVEDVRSRTGAPSQAGAKATRDLAIVRLLHDLMLRRSEVAGLDLEHVEERGGTPAAIWILGKGRSDRQRFEIPNATGLALEAWLAARGRQPGPLFCPLDRPIPATGAPRRLADGSINRNVVGDVGRRAKLARPVRPHGLRHEGITRSIELGATLLETQKAARHVDPKTTERYIDRFNDPTARIHRQISED